MGDSWVGGDIGALRTMSDTYKNAKEKLDGVVKPLTRVVDELATDASWKGEAASTFRGQWTADAITAGAFATLVYDAGKILGDLADALSTCDTALKNAEHVATRKGVPTGGGGVVAPTVTSDPTTAAAVKEYETARTEILHTAQHARLVAADKLRGLYLQVTKKDSSVSTGDKITIDDFLRGLYAYSAEDTRADGKKARTQIDAAKAEERAAKKQLKAERRVFQQQGRRMPDDLPAKSAYDDAVGKVKALEDDILAADHGGDRLPLDRALNVKMVDAAHALRVGEGVEKLPDFLKEVPVLDVAAAGACGLLEAKDDHDKGWSWQHSIVVDGGAALGGLAVGAAITAALPVEGAAAVCVVGTGVIIGATGIIDHSFHEHWSEDIHDHGVVGGLLHGSGHVLSQTGDDFVRLKDDVWHGIKSFL
ncbi:WXG100 family type VII secretion target [Streptomyces sp. NPDC096012]|uniref:WXG100 family type VII secretion target n=1 Tax=Streptomyces sp. NPDC096012 TaxID=3155684 RepID=UPI00336A9C2C